MKNPYQILGVGRKASPADIKKAYRRLAMLHHPDRGGDENKFKEVTEAYDILSDPNKKRDFDSGGLNTVFREHFRRAYEAKKERRSQAIFQALFRKAKEKVHIPRDEEIKFNISTDLLSIKNGVIQNVVVNRKIPCSDCAGKGGESFVTCSVCRGQGYEYADSMKLPCLTCLMKGSVPEPVCGSCNGVGVRMARQEFSFEIKEKKQ